MENYLRWECGTDFVKKNMEVFLKCKDMLEELSLDQSEICMMGNLGSSILAYLLGIFITQDDKLVII